MLLQGKIQSFAIVALLFGTTLAIADSSNVGGANPFIASSDSNGDAKQMEKMHKEGKCDDAKQMEKMHAAGKCGDAKQIEKMHGKCGDAKQAGDKPTSGKQDDE